MSSSAVLGNEHGIPVLDFGAFLTGSPTAKGEFADAILDSFKTVGFVYLKNHGIPQEQIQNMFDWSKQFFAQPMETKMLAPHPPSGVHHRGYSAPGMEKVVQYVFDEDERKSARAKAPDVKESFESGWEDSDSMPNIWLPEGVLPGFREACQDFFWTCHDAELSILRALALALGFAEDYFAEMHNAHDNQLRLLHYPSVPTDKLAREEISRIDSHSDLGSITLLFQDDVGGLEVEDPNHPGQFILARPIEGTLLVNAGDLLMRWSNDTIRSTIHRVRAPPGLTDGMTPDRYSIPYFCAPEPSTVIECLPGTYSDLSPPKYQPISALEYITERMALNY